MLFKSVEAGESQDLESLVIELVHCLNSLSENLASNASDDDEQENDANSNAGDEDHEIDVTTLNEVIQVLDDILKFLSSPLMNQVLFFISSFSFESQQYFIYITYGYFFLPNSIVLHRMLSLIHI